MITTATSKPPLSLQPHNILLPGALGTGCAHKYRNRKCTSPPAGTVAYYHYWLIIGMNQNSNVLIPTYISTGHNTTSPFKQWPNFIVLSTLIAKPPPWNRPRQQPPNYHRRWARAVRSSLMPSSSPPSCRSVTVHPASDDSVHPPDETLLCWSIAHPVQSILARSLRDDK